MNSNLTVLPVLLPFVTAGAALLLGRPSPWRRRFVLLSAVAQLGVACAFVYATTASPEHATVFALVPGDWAARFGIALVVDGLSAIMLALGALTALASLVFGFVTSPAEREHPLRLPLVQFHVTGIQLAFVTGDLFNLFVAFEVMLLASYALLTAEADDHDIKFALPYVTLNLFGSTIFLMAAGYCYGMFGTLNLAEISVRWFELGALPELTLLTALLMIVFGVKSGLFPLYYWLPATYPILPSAVSALYSGMLTKVGVYAFLRLFGTIVPGGHPELQTVLAYLAGATMLFGVLGAVSRESMRGILSFHIISQIGFMLFAIGIGTELAFTAAIFYIVHHIVVKSTLFLSAGIVATLNRTDNLADMGGIWKAAPLAGLVFLIQALSLAGIPPLSGFWGKYLIIVEGLGNGWYFLTAVSVLASILTLYSMIKIWNAAFWNENPRAQLRVEDGRWKSMTAVAGVLVTISLCIGLGAGPVFERADRAAAQLIQRDSYVRAVHLASASADKKYSLDKMRSVKAPSGSKEDEP